MVDVIDVEPVPDAGRLENLRQLTLFTYILYACTLFGGLPAIVAIVINYIKLDDARGTLYESHFRWQIHTFWWALVWAALGVISMFVLIGFAILFADFVWCVYRAVKGILYWQERRPMPV